MRIVRGPTILHSQVAREPAIVLARFIQESQVNFLQLYVFRVKLDRIDEPQDEVDRLSDVHIALVMLVGSADADKQGRMLTPRSRGKREEVAKAILFMASDDSSYCLVSEFMVDGGLAQLVNPA